MYDRKTGLMQKNHQQKVNRPEILTIFQEGEILKWMKKSRKERKIPDRLDFVRKVKTGLISLIELRKILQKKGRKISFKRSI